LDAAELAELNADLETTLTDRFAVQRPVNTDNGGGRQGKAFAEQPPGRYPFGAVWTKQSTRDLAEQIEGGASAGGLKSVTIWYVQLPWDTDIQNTDRLKINDMILEVAGGDGKSTETAGKLVICRRIA